MSVKSFLDTNIICYCFDRTAPLKQQRAEALVSRARSEHDGCISFQVVQEFLNICQRKFETPMTAAEAALYMRTVLQPVCEVFPSFDLLQSALEIKDRYGFHFYDALIVAAALEAGCERLYSEDMQHGQAIGSLRIENPFTI
jgi:predicted nucleic acid-binding protein